MLEHHGIASLKTFFETNFGIKGDDRIIQFAPYSFDASVWEISMALLLGNTLYIVSKEILNDPRQFEDYLNRNQITIATLPPAYLASLDPNRIHTLRLNFGRFGF